MPRPPNLFSLAVLKWLFFERRGEVALGFLLLAVGVMGFGWLLFFAASPAPEALRTSVMPRLNPDTLETLRAEAARRSEELEKIFAHQYPDPFVPRSTPTAAP